MGTMPSSLMVPHKAHRAVGRRRHSLVPTTAAPGDGGPHCHVRVGMCTTAALRLESAAENWRGCVTSLVAPDPVKAQQQHPQQLFVRIHQHRLPNSPAVEAGVMKVGGRGLPDMVDAEAIY